MTIIVFCPLLSSICGNTKFIHRVCFFFEHANGMLYHALGGAVILFSLQDLIAPALDLLQRTTFSLRKY